VEKRKHVLWNYFLCIIFFTLTFTLNAEELTVDPNIQIKNLTPEIYLYEDKTTSLSIKDISSPEFEKKFIKNNRKATPYWLTASAIWGKINLDLQNTRNNYYLLFPNPIMEYVEVFIPDINGGYVKLETGHGIDIKKRPVPDRKIIIPLKSNAFPFADFSKGKIYFRVFSPQNEFDLKTYLVTDFGLSREKEIDAAFQGSFLGIMIAMFFYNLFIYFAIGNRSYLLYILYILGTCITIMGAQGITHRYFISSFSLDLWNLGFVALLTMTTGNLFTQNFLELKINLPRINRVFSILNFILLITIISKFFNAIIFNHLYFLLLLSSSILCLTSGFILYRRFAFARDFSHAWLVIIVADILYSVAASGIYIPASVYFVQIGHVIEAVVLSIALARQIRYLQAEKKKLGIIERDIALAEEIQKTLFPRELPHSAKYELSGRYKPSGKMSGDFYDVTVGKDNVLCVFLVDVAGHGYAAGLVAAMIKVAFHESLEKCNSPAEHQKEINRILLQNVENTFATSINIRIHAEEKKLYLARAGHAPTLHYKNKSFELVEYSPGGIPLGILDKYSCEEILVHYDSGDRVILFTDGLIEGINVNGEEFGMNRLKDMVLKQIQKSPREFCDILYNEISFWINSRDQEDDITYLVIDLH